MGYGIKTDYATGRELDLDKTYQSIIKPAAETAGLECIRADEIRHSGIIDVPMYNQLISADVVIADLSTNNSNAFYELGVRHALRPKTTITIAENELKPPFDVNHTVIRQYEHLGKDIGYSEVKRFRKELIDAIETILSTDEIDSPVYTYIKDLIPPTLNFTNSHSSLNEGDRQEKNLSDIIENARIALDKDDFLTAKALFQYASTIDSNNDYIKQKLAFCTYKAKIPNYIDALNEALDILNQLRPNSSTDPETLGLIGAIYKRLWEETKETSFLNKSIYFYEKGFYIKNDYYNGINLAYLLNVRGNIEKDKNESITDYTIANRVRYKVIDICDKLSNSEKFKDRSDQYWILATLEEAYFGVGNQEKYLEIQNKAMSFSKHNWERSTTVGQILKVGDLLKDSPLT